MNKVWEWIKPRLQLIASILILIAACLAHVKEMGIAFGLLIVVLIIELYLWRAKKTLITNWWRPVVIKWGDRAILIGWVASLLHFNADFYQNMSAANIGWHVLLVGIVTAIITHLCEQ